MNATTYWLRRVGWIIVVLIVLSLTPLQVSNCRNGRAEAEAGQLFMQMQQKNAAETLRGAPAEKLRDEILAALDSRNLKLNVINTTTDALSDMIRRGYERDARETLEQLRSTHADVDKAIKLASAFEKYRAYSMKTNEYFGTSAQNIDDKNLFRNKIEKAIADHLHVTAAECKKAGITMPTKTVTKVVRVPAKAKAPAKDKKPVAKTSGKKLVVKAEKSAKHRR